MNRRETRGDT